MNPETILQNKIIVALNQRGHHAVNHTVGEFYTKYGGVVKVGTPGEADIFGHRYSDGKAFYIEVKLPGQKPRAEQRRFIEEMKKTNAIADWCTSVEQAIHIVEGWDGI